MVKGNLRFGVIVDLQGALELALGDGGGGAGIDFNRINPIKVVEAAVERHGIKIIELPMDANYVIPGIMEKPENALGLKRLRDDLGLEFTMHLPFFQLALCSINEHVRKASIETQVESIKLCEQFGGIKNYVLHVTGDLEDTIGAFNVPRHYKNLAWGMLMDKGYDSIEEIISRTGVDPAKICIENMEGVPFTEVYDILIEDLGTSICLDVGHAILQQEESPLDIMKHWKDKVHEIHLHNVLYSKIRNRIHVYEDHRGLTSGVLDVKAFLDHLVAVDYTHPVMLEIMTQDEIADSLRYIENLGFTVK